MGRVVRGVLAIAVLATCLSVAFPGRARGALLVWSLSPTVVTATAGQLTTITFTAANLDILGRDLGCLEIDLPASYSSISATVGKASNGDEWDASIVGSAVVVFSESGGGELRGPLLGGLLGESVTFTVRMVPTVGIATWANHAHQSHNCDGANEVGVPVAATVLPALLPTPTPTPVPTPKPTSKPTPKPTPRPTPTPTIPLPIPLPSLPLPSLPLPSLPLPLPSTGLPTVAATASPSPTPRGGTPTPRVTATPAPSPVGSPGTGNSSAPTSDAGAPPAGPPQGGGGVPKPVGVTAPTIGRDVPRLDFDPAALDIDFESVGLLSGTTVWLVPTATFAIPAVLLLLFVALQAVGALAWVPAVRRLSGRDDEVA